MISFKYLVAFLPVLVFVTLTGSTVAEELCKSGSGSVWRRHPSNCSSLYICVLGEVVLYPLCADGRVVASDSKTCVPMGSSLDDCTTRSVDIEDRLPKTCKIGEKHASPTSCARYSECVTLGKFRTQLVKMECPYPLLFDVSSGKCDHYKNVQCQPGQTVPKGQCDYDANQCRTTHCVPCEVRFPSCTGKQDGLNPWTGKEWSPYFVICGDERVLYQGQCKNDKETQIFDPLVNNCVIFEEKKFDLKDLFTA